MMMIGWLWSPFHSGHSSFNTPLACDHHVVVNNAVYTCTTYCFLTTIPADSWESRLLFGKVELRR